MEITNEIKANVFSLYRKKRMQWIDGSGDQVETVMHGVFYRPLDGRKLGDKAVTMLNGQEVIVRIDSCKLILKPLSDITEEHASIVANMFYSESYSNIKVDAMNNTSLTNSSGYKFTIFADGSGFRLQNEFKDVQEIHCTEILAAFQFLQSEGYDVPQYLLGGKTLFEADLCVYEKIV